MPYLLASTTPSPCLIYPCADRDRMPCIAPFPDWDGVSPGSRGIPLGFFEDAGATSSVQRTRCTVRSSG